MRQPGLAPLLLVAMMFAASFGAGAEAQGTTAGQGKMEPGHRTPLGVQGEPSALTPEQELLREEIMKRTNLPGPPLPLGPPEVESPRPTVPSTEGQPGTPIIAPVSVPAPALK